MAATRRLEVDADLRNLVVIREFLDDAAARLHVPARTATDMIQAVEEAAMNVIMHGYHGGPGKLAVVAGAEQDAFVVRLRDQAPPFDPTQVPEPNLAVPLEERRPGGLGIFMMRQFTDEQTYVSQSGGSNELTLVRRFAGERPGGSQ